MNHVVKSVSKKATPYCYIAVTVSHILHKSSVSVEIVSSDIFLLIFTQT